MKKGMKIFVITAASLVSLGVVGAIAVGTNGFKNNFAWGNFTHTAAALTIDNTDLSKKAVTPNLDYSYDATLKTAVVTGLGKEYDQDYINIPEVIAKDGVNYTVTGIAENAYLGGGHVVGIYVPASVTAVGMNAFADDNYVWGYADGYVGGSTLKKIQFASGSKITATSGTAADGTTKYGYFSNLFELRTIVLPAGLTEIGEGAFTADQSLLSVSIGPKVTKVGSKAFYGCLSLASVAIPSSVTSLGSNAFSDCASLKTISIPDSVTLMDFNCFGACTSLKTVSIGSGIVELYQSVFGACTSLKTVSIPQTVKWIDKLAFNDCWSLSEVAFAGTPTIVSVGEQAFLNCTALSSFSAPNTLSKIEARAFFGSSITRFVGGTGLTGVGEQAFANCHALKEVILKGTGLTTVGANAFDNSWNATVYTNNKDATLFTDANNPEKLPVYVYGAWTYSNDKVVLADGAKPANATTTTTATSSSAA